MPLEEKAYRDGWWDGFEAAGCFLSNYGGDQYKEELLEEDWNGSETLNNWSESEYVMDAKGFKDGQK